MENIKTNQKHIVKFKNWTCTIIKRQYSNKRIALQLIDHISHELIATATVNIPEIILAPNEIIIKDYSENTGMLKTLVNANIVKDISKTVRTGYVECSICKLLI